SFAPSPAESARNVNHALDMALPIKFPFPPMEALAVDAIPTEPGWQFEPKWDGFRCLAFRDGAKITLQSKAGQPLTRYFPEVVESHGKSKLNRLVIDGELVVPVTGRLGAAPLTASSPSGSIRPMNPANGSCSRSSRSARPIVSSADFAMPAAANSSAHCSWACSTTRASCITWASRQH